MLAGWLDETLRSTVKSITVESSFSPPITLTDPFAPSPPGAKGAATWIKPKITINTGSGPMVIKPYGEPEPHWRDIQLGLIALGLLAGFGIVYLVKRGRGRC